MAISKITLANHYTRVYTVVISTFMAVMVALILMPKAEYLPQGNRNLILNILVPQPGLSDARRADIGRYIYDQLQPYTQEDYKDDVPQIKNIFYVSSDRISLFGGTSHHDTEAREMMPLFSKVMNSIPGMFGVSVQQGIFAQSIGKGRTVDINVSGENTEELIAAARILYGTVKKFMPEARIRPVPSLEISYPEVNIKPDRSKVIANGLSEVELGVYIDVLMDGRKIGEYKPSGGKVMDLVLRSDDRAINSPEDVLERQIVNSFGQILRVGDLAEMEYSQGMTQIDHFERKRNIRLEVTPPDSTALQIAMELIDTRIVPALVKRGLLKDSVSVTVGGNADKLVETRDALKWNLIMAVVIIYLLMSAMFSNYLYPVIIMLTIPLAAAGGFIGLSLINGMLTRQPFDILVMLGFIILVGTVVNNAILIVHQALNNVRFAGMEGVDAVTHSVRTRIRPIFMSMATSVFGLLPLVLATGSGSELYRGLGSVILGGLAISTLLTLFVIPAFLVIFIGFEVPKKAELSKKAQKSGDSLSLGQKEWAIIGVFGAAIAYAIYTLFTMRTIGDVYAEKTKFRPTKDFIEVFKTYFESLSGFWDWAVWGLGTFVAIAILILIPQLLDRFGGDNWK